MEVNVKSMNVFLVVEPLVTPDVVDVIVMLSGRKKSTLVFPKNTTFVAGDVYTVTPNVFVFIVIVRFAEVPVKAVSPIDVTESGMFMDDKLVASWKAAKPIDVSELPIFTDVKPLQRPKTSTPIDVTELGIVNDVKPLHVLKA